MTTWDIRVVTRDQTPSSCGYHTAVVVKSTRSSTGVNQVLTTGLLGTTTVFVGAGALQAGLRGLPAPEPRRK